MDLDALVPYQVCINLDRRPDRWDRMRRRLAGAGLHSVVRFPAIDGGREQRPEVWAERPGAFGCLRSHVEVVRAAHRAKVPNVLVLEDDTELADSWRERLAAAWSSLPEDWGLLYLGCNHLVPPVPVNNGLARVVQAHSTFAYVLRETAYNAFLAVNRRSDRPLDVNLLRLQQERACYALWPNAAWVDEDQSDVQQSHESYWYLRESILVTPQALEDLKGRLLLIVPLSSAGWRATTPETVIFHVRQFVEAFPWLDVALGVDQPTGRARDDAAILAALAREVGPRDLRAVSGFNSELPARGQRLDALADRLGERHRFVLCVGSPVHLPTRLLRAAVQMCRRFELVLPFRQARPLSPSQTQALIAGRSRWYDPTLCQGSGKSARRLRWWFLDLEAARRRDLAMPASRSDPFRRPLGPPAAWNCSEEAPMAAAGVQQLTQFEAPCLALRLASRDLAYDSK